MNKRIVRALLIALLLVSSACSFVRTGYDQADTLLYWWLDRYLDFNRAQSREVKPLLRELHAWHRSTQLPEHADMLAGFAAIASGDLTSAQACTGLGRVREKAESLTMAAVPTLARIAVLLETENLNRLRRKFAEDDREWREKWLDGRPDKLAEERYDDWADRADHWYGRLNAEQKQFIRNAIARSSLDPQLNWRLRQQRQQDVLATLEQIVKTRPPAAEAEAAIAALVQRALHVNDPSGEQMRLKLFDEGCANIAALHQLATPAQRQRAKEKLLAYEKDFRKLAQR